VAIEQITDFPELHGLIIGGSGKGKSYAANEWYKRAENGAIFYNFPSKYRRDYEIPGKTFSYKHLKQKKYREAIKKLLKAGKRIRYRSHPNPEIALKEIKILYEIAKQVRKETDKQVLFVIDELSEYAPEGCSFNVIFEIAKRGRGWVHFIGVDQFVANLNKGVVRQLYDQAIFGVGRYDEEYFKGKGYPVEQIDAATSKKEFGFVIYNIDNDRLYRTVWRFS